MNRHIFICGRDLHKFVFFFSHRDIPMTENWKISVCHVFFYASYFPVINCQLMLLILIMIQNKLILLHPFWLGKFPFDALKHFEVLLHAQHINNKEQVSQALVFYPWQDLLSLYITRRVIYRDKDLAMDSKQVRIFNFN